MGSSIDVKAPQLDASVSYDYTILGAGALGSVFGARLALAGHRVQLLTRSPAHPKAIRQDGLLFECDGVQHRVAVDAGQTADVGSTRAVLCFTKTSELLPAVQSVVDRVGPDTLFITLQNGLGNGERLADVVGSHRVIHGVTMVPADFKAPGVVETHGEAATWLNVFGDTPAQLATVVAHDLQHAGLQTTVDPAIAVRIWQKACFNVAMNGLCGLITGSPGMLHAYPDGELLAHDIADEAIAVAHAEGCSVDPDAVHGLIAMACANHTFHKPSMLQDLAAGRLTEIESLNGYVQSKADQLGVETPLNALILRLVRLRERAPEFWAQVSSPGTC